MIPEKVPGFEEEFPTTEAPPTEPPPAEPPPQELPPEEQSLTPELTPIGSPGTEFTIPQTPLSLPPSTPGITESSGPGVATKSGSVRSFLSPQPHQRPIRAGAGTPNTGSIGDDPEMLKLIRGRLNL